jgi:hypothetical protein
MGRPRKVKEGSETVQPQEVSPEVQKPQEDLQEPKTVSIERYNELKLELIQTHDWLKTVATRLRNIANQDAQELCNTVQIRNANIGKVAHAE